MTEIEQNLRKCVLEIMPDLEKFLPRARFYAQAIELQWVLFGIDTGDKFWFTAHIGEPWDIQEIG